MRNLIWTLLSLGAAGCLIVTAASVGCGTEDPIDEACAAICSQKNDDPCFDQVAKCVNSCKAIAGNAAMKGYKAEACGVCIAKRFRFTGKTCKSATESCVFEGDTLSKCEPLDPCDATSKKCFGFLKPQFTDPACTAECIEPDAGVSY